MIRLKTLLEQVFLSNVGTGALRGFDLTKAASTGNRGTGNLRGPSDGVDTMDGQGLKSYDSRKQVEATFKKARLLNRLATTASDKKAAQLHDHISGIGGNSGVLTILKGIKDLRELGAIITSYKKLYSVALWKDISSEWGLTWNKLWDSIEHVNPNESAGYPVLAMS